MHDWVSLLYSRNWHNVVNQLYFKNKRKSSTVESNPKEAHLTYTNLTCKLSMNTENINKQANNLKERKKITDYLQWFQDKLFKRNVLWPQT